MLPWGKLAFRKTFKNIQTKTDKIKSILEEYNHFSNEAITNNYKHISIFINHLTIGNF